jgi:hypothetical protein
LHALALDVANGTIMEFNTREAASPRSLAFVLKLTSATRLIDRIDDPSQSMLRI